MSNFKIGEILSANFHQEYDVGDTTRLIISGHFENMRKGQNINGFFISENARLEKENKALRLLMNQIEGKIIDAKKERN